MTSCTELCYLLLDCLTQLDGKLPDRMTMVQCSNHLLLPVKYLQLPPFPYSKTSVPLENELISAEEVVLRYSRLVSLYTLGH